MNKSLWAEHDHCKGKILFASCNCEEYLRVSRDGGHCLKEKITTCRTTHLTAESWFVPRSLIEITGSGLLELRNFLLEKCVFRWFLFYMDLGNSSVQVAWIYEFHVSLLLIRLFTGGGFQQLCQPFSALPTWHVWIWYSEFISVGGCG